MNRKKRLADFASRAEAAPDSVQTIGSIGRYVSVNPMSDEAELLDRLGIEASTCTKVDLYWEHGDVWFVQIQAESYEPTRRPGIYARLAPSAYVNVVVVVPERVISSDVVTRVLRDVARRSLRIDRLCDTLQPL